jgi:hypothetical protein
MEIPRNESFPKGKQPKNSLPNASLMSQHFALSNPLFAFSTTNFVKIFFFSQLLFCPFFVILLGEGH